MLSKRSYNGIVLSGPPVSGKSTLARRLSGIYGWPNYSAGNLFREKWRTLYPNGEVSFEDYWRSVSPEENLAMNQRMRKIVEKGNAIADIRYTIVYADLPVLLVLVTAPLDVRARRCFDTGWYKEKPFEEVRQILAERERDEVRVGKELYGNEYDFRDPAQYHLILDSELLSVDQRIAAVTSLITS